MIFKNWTHVDPLSQQELRAGQTYWYSPFLNVGSKDLCVKLRSQPVEVKVSLELQMGRKLGQDDWGKTVPRLPILPAKSFKISKRDARGIPMLGFCRTPPPQESCGALKTNSMLFHHMHLLIGALHLQMRYASRISIYILNNRGLVAVRIALKFFNSLMICIAFNISRNMNARYKQISFGILLFNFVLR